jgi:hypothetical protein
MLTVSKKGLSNACVLAFLAINMPFWFVDAIVPVVVHRSMGIVLLAIALFTARKLSIHPILLLLWTFFLFLNLSKFLLPSLTLQNAIWFTGLPVIVVCALLFGMDRESLGRVFGGVCWLTIIVTVPAIIIWFALLGGVQLPYSMISLHGRPDYYRNYFDLAIFVDYNIFDFGGVTIARLSGMFEEPGMLGTIIGVFLVTDTLFLKDKARVRKILMVSIGILTFSLAFFVMLLFITVYYIVESRARFSRAVFAILVGVVLLSTQTVVSQVAELFFFGRLQFNPDRGIYGNNRAVYGERFFGDYLVNAPLGRLYFGNGLAANETNTEGGYNSYLSIVYDYGVIAAMLALAFVTYFAMIPILRWRRALAAILLMGPLLSLYQRPDIQGIHYLLLFAMLFAHRHTAAYADPPSLALEAAPA